jgi:Mitochondrial carrier protein
MTKPLLHLQQDGRSHVVRNSLLAGSVAGITSTLACHPFDVIRTKMQSASLSMSGSTNAARGPMQVVSQTLQHGGFKALYTGLALPLAAQAIYKATIFTINNVTQASLIQWNTATESAAAAPYSLTLTDHFICGFVAGGVNAALFVTPVEYIRSQLIRQHSLKAAGQHLPNAYKGTLDVIRATIKQSSLWGLWKGGAVTVARDSIGVAFFFGSMQWCQGYLTRQYTSQRQEQDHTQQPTPSFAITMVSGAMAGLGYWVVALPLDSVKTWVQSDMADSAIQALTTCLREHGLNRTLVKLFAGYQVAYGRGIPSAAITVASYSLCYSALQEPTKQE